jgi:hypothetical protein
MGRASCLERSLLRQAWLDARGYPLDVVIGVKRGKTVEAHAWVDGDPNAADWIEIHRIAPRVSALDDTAVPGSERSSQAGN